MSPKTNRKKVSKGKILDAQIEKITTAEHKQLALSLPGVIAQDRRVEWEIVSNYLRRTNQLLVPGGA